MKMFRQLILIAIACILAGCSRREPTLDEAIDALPDEWGIYSEKFERFARKAGTTVLNRESSTNNYATLNKVIALTNAQERIRLTWKLYNHFRRTPEWLVEHREEEYRNRERCIFLNNCAWSLMVGTNTTSETIFEGWKINAEIVKDMAALVRLTGPEWQARMQKRHDEKKAAEYEELRKRLKAHGGGMMSFLSTKEAPEIAFAAVVRWEFAKFFRHSFAGASSYRKLPDELKPAFVEMLKRDFFIYSDVTNDFMWKKYPPELKEAYREVQERLGAK